MLARFVLAAGLAFGVARQVSMDVQPQQVAFDDPFTVTFNVPSRCFLDEFPQSDQYKIVTMRKKKNQNLHLIKNGYSSTHYEHQSAGYDVTMSYVLRPLKGGTVAIPPILAHCGDVDLETPLKTVRVSGGPKETPAVPETPKSAPKPADPGISDSMRPMIQDIPQTVSKPVAPPEPHQKEVTETVLLRNPLAPPVEEAPKKPLEQAPAARPETAATAPANPRMLLLGVLGLCGLAVLLIAAKNWWAAKNKRVFARGAPLPDIALRKEEDVIGGKYKIVKEIGSGGMGLVYLAKDLKLLRSVAIKKMRSELQFSTEQRQNFMREAMIISRLSHPYIVAIHEIIEQDGGIYMIFDYVDGKPLSSLIDSKKPLSLKYCQDIFSYVCQAVDFAHKNNVLHQDLKPSNIMVDANGFAKVMDFGLAREAVVASNEIWGTLAYMAPERHMGVGTASADIYSLGVCLYEMLGARLPFTGPEFQAQKENMDYVALTKLRPDLPKGIDDLLKKALAPSPKDRTPGALELLEELKKL